MAAVLLRIAGFDTGLAVQNGSVQKGRLNSLRRADRPAIMSHGIAHRGSTSSNQTRRRRHIGTAGEDSASQRRLLHPQVVAEQALEHRAKIDGGLEIATLVQLGNFQARPVGDDASALESAGQMSMNSRSGWNRLPPLVGRRSTSAGAGGSSGTGSGIG